MSSDPLRIHLSQIRNHRADPFHQSTILTYKETASATGICCIRLYTETGAVFRYMRIYKFTEKSVDRFQLDLWGKSSFEEQVGCHIWKNWWLYDPKINRNVSLSPSTRQHLLSKIVLPNSRQRSLFLFQLPERSWKQSQYVGTNIKSRALPLGPF